MPPTAGEVATLRSGLIALEKSTILQMRAHAKNLTELRRQLVADRRYFLQVIAETKRFLDACGPKD